MQLAQGLLPLATAALYRANSAAKQTELQRATDALRTQHPELVTPAETKGGALGAAAKNLRTQLRKAFPGVKFSVTTDRFSGGDSLRVSWVDGPAVDRVESLACQYKAGSFDGYDDLYTYQRTAWTEAFGDAKYVSCSRDYSPQIAAWLLAEDLPYPQRWEAQRERHSQIYHLSIKAVKASTEEV